MGGVEDGFNSLGSNHARSGQRPQSQKTGNPGEMGHVVNTAFNDGDQLANNVFMGQHAKGNDDFILSVHFLGLFQFSDEEGDPLLLKNTAILVAHLTHNPDGVLDIAVLAQAGLLQKGRDGHDGNIPGQFAALDLGGLDQLNKLFKSLLGGEHQSVGQHVEKRNHLDLGHFSGFHMFLEEVDRFRGTSHDNSIQKQVIVTFKFRLDLFVDRSNFRLPEQSKATRNRKDLHGDLLFNGFIFNGSSQFPEDSLEHGPDFFNDLGFGKVLESSHGDSRDGFGQLFGFLSNVMRKATLLLALFFLALDGFVSLIRVFIHHVLQRSHVGRLGPGALGADFLEPQDLEGSSDNPFSVHANQVLVEFSLVDDALNHEITTLSTSNVAGFRGPGPQILAVRSIAHDVSRVEVREVSTSFAVINILGLDNFVVLVFLALMAVGNQFRSITDHVLGQFIDLVGDFANTINVFFLGFPKVHVTNLFSLLLLFLSQPRGRINLGLEKDSHSLFQVDRPFRLISGDFGLTDFTLRQLKNNWPLQKLHNLRVNLGHLGQVDLAPILAIKAIIGGDTSLKTLVNIGEAGFFEGKLQLVRIQNIDQNSSIKSKTRVVGSQTRDLTQKATTVLKNMSFASLPTPFGGKGSGEGTTNQTKEC